MRGAHGRAALKLSQWKRGDNVRAPQIVQHPCNSTYRIAIHVRARVPHALLSDALPHALLHI